MSKCREEPIATNGNFAKEKTRPIMNYERIGKTIKKYRSKKSKIQ